MKDLLLINRVIPVCANASLKLMTIGYIITCLKIGIPIILIVMGFTNLFKKTGNKKTGSYIISIILRISLGFVIYYLPSLILTIYFLPISPDSGSRPDFIVCYKCLIRPYSDTCTNAVRTINSSSIR